MFTSSSKPFTGTIFPAANISFSSDPSTLIQSVNRKEALQLMEEGVISGGMIPKVKSAVDALNAGVRKVHFIDGRVPHTLLLEIFTPEGIGTEIVREQR